MVFLTCLGGLVGLETRIPNSEAVTWNLASRFSIGFRQDICQLQKGVQYK